MLLLFLWLSAFALPPGTPGEITAAATDLPFGIIEFVANSKAEPGSPVMYTVYYLKEENSAPNQELIIAGIRRASQPNIDTPVAADVRALNTQEIQIVAGVFNRVLKSSAHGVEFEAGDKLCGGVVNKISEFRFRTFPDQKTVGRNCLSGKISADAELLLKVIETAVNDKSRPTLLELQKHK